jgi:hypothetical protein
MSLFEDALAAASTAIDGAMADDEGWIYQPVAVANGDVNDRAAPDPDRAAIPIDGVFIDPYARAHSGPSRHQGLKAERPGHASSRPQIDFDLTQLPYRPRNGDRVRRLKTGKTYHLAEVKFPAAGPRAQIDLNEI